jgi:transcriptional regulator with XRE-family HTH domain
MNTQTEVLNLCEILKTRRSQKKINQTELGKILNLTHSSVSRMEKKTFNISLEKFIKWADALDLEISLIPKAKI